MTTLVVIAKEPLPGRAKTRLHPPLSLEQAALVAAAAIDDTLRAMAAVPAERRILLFDGVGAAAGLRRLRDRAAGRRRPRRAPRRDLRREQRADRARRHGHPTADARRTWLPRSGLAAGAGGADAWFGPASDGGFWALGLREPRGDLIRGVPMSTDTTGAQQLRRLEDAGLTVGILDTLDDVDTIDDARTVAALAPMTRFAAVLSGFGVACA